MVTMGSCLDSIDSNTYGSVCAIFETNWEGETTCQFAMKLRFSCSSTNGTPTNQVRQVLWRNGIQHLTRYQLANHHCICKVPTGTPIERSSLYNPLAVLNPLLIWKDPSISGSLMSPFQPTVVLGFSK